MASRSVRSVRFASQSLTLVALAAGPALAASHNWRFSEFYSSADGSIQFIEMQEIAGANAEVNLANKWFATDTFNVDHSQVLGANLTLPTAHRKFLVGSASYAALPDVPVPDYVLPDGFLDPAGDTMVWWFYQTIEIPPGVMPVQGGLSISVVDPNVPTYSVGPNSPTNLAGDTGTISLPSGVPSLQGWWLPIAALLLAMGGWAYARRTSTTTVAET